MDAKLHKQYQEVQESHWWFRVRDNLLHDIAKKYFKPGGSVLDFGCNYGHATRDLQAQGFNAYGLDVSHDAVSFGRSLGIKNIFLDSEKSFVENYFDAAISLDVLEHIENDEKAFAYIASRVKSGGIIVIMVPTYMFLWGVQDEIAHHFRRYTMQSLIEVSKKAGDFEIVKKSYFNTFLFLPIALVRLWTRFFVSHPRDSDLDMNSPFVNRVLHWIFDIERKCLRHVNFPFGISALLILRKK